MSSGELGPRIGLLGGTFDPLHNGHLALARAAKRQFALDAVLFIPAARPPHKPDYHLSSFSDRLSMIEETIAEEEDFFSCRIESEHSGLSYTIDTLKRLNSQLPERDFFFIIGLDAFNDIFTWKRYGELLDFTHLLVANRPDSSLVSVKNVVARYFPELLYRSDLELWQHPGGGTISVLEMEPFDVSSTTIRQRVGRQQGISALVPARVDDFILRHRLYR